jgi:microcystin-dependent protein
MASPFVAEIRMFAGNFAPTGWALCNGQILPISQNTALFSLLGTTYGGNGKSTFALPNLQGSVPIHAGQGNGLSLYDLGQQSGSETVTLLQTEIPAHNHPVVVRPTGNIPPIGIAAANVGARSNSRPYNSDAPNATMDPLTGLTIAGSSLPHNNMMPYLALTFIIALQGVFPPRT